MKPRMVRKYWTQLLIAFDCGYTLEGFKKTEKNLELPENLLRFEARLKRELTICNLFVNHNQSISSIARVLDMKYGQVVTTLMDHGFIKERRRTVKKSEIESSPMRAASEAIKPKTEKLDKAVPMIELGQPVPSALSGGEDKTLSSGILDINWLESERLVWPGGLNSLGLSNSGAAS